MSKLNINDITYNIIDISNNITFPDCTVWRTNKTGSGNGEAKLYIGNEKPSLFELYGNKGFKIKCVIKKDDCLKYLEDAKDEYLNPSQNYQKKSELPQLYEERIEKINQLNDFEFFEFSHQSQLEPPRVYVNSSDNIYKLIRQLVLPEMSFITFCKIQNIETGEIIFYIRIFVDYSNPIFEFNHVEIAESEKKQITKARKGQAKYREKLLEECPFCPITTIGDDRLLIASHIKPFSKSNNSEKYDPKNGFMLTPTFDWLFDKGFISFNDDKSMIVSPWISPLNCKKLGIFEGKKVPSLPIEGRLKYLEYHRKFVYKSMG
tara:strand:- start:4298 stop:5254 length:957 start_codon:yes stop_codon:yes gene_type:complete